MRTLVALFVIVILGAVWLAHDVSRSQTIQGDRVNRVGKEPSIALPAVAPPVEASSPPPLSDDDRRMLGR